MAHDLVFTGKKIIWGTGSISEGSFLVRDGEIISTSKTMFDFFNSKKYEVIDAGEKVIMPGVVDSHVHVNEPGRTHWEGYETATKAAAAGGITTIVDMPLNCIPATTSMDGLEAKLKSADGKCHVDVCLWGGIVPENVNELSNMVDAGVVGFKGFLCESGVDEFKCINKEQIEDAMKELKDKKTVFLFHAEKTLNNIESTDSNKDGKNYEIFLQSRSPQMEVEAISIIIELCRKYRVPCHIVHLSTSKALHMIKEAKIEGLPLTVETCHHYLNIAAEDIPENATHFKCCPPIRERINQMELWKGLNEGIIDMVVSDHSPCSPDLKDPEKFDFLTAWGGISSVQFGLRLMWTAMNKNGDFDLCKLHNLLTKNTSKLCRLSGRKGTIENGMDADIVIWDPTKKIKVTPNIIYHKHKITPYMERELNGLIHQTYVRGNLVYGDNGFQAKPAGRIILLKN